MWDLINNRQVATLTGHNAPVNTIRRLSNCAFLASASDDGTILLWDLETNRCIASFAGDTEAGLVALAAMQNDSLAVGGDFGHIHVLDCFPDVAAKTRWLARFAHGVGFQVAPPPPDVATVAIEFQVNVVQLHLARHIETYRGRHLFGLADGRVYLDGLIAVATLDLARATLDELARRAGEPEA
jgi:hypothetical protein